MEFFFLTSNFVLLKLLYIVSITLSTFPQGLTNNPTTSDGAGNNCGSDNENKSKTSNIVKFSSMFII